MPHPTAAVGADHPLKVSPNSFDIDISEVLFQENISALLQKGAQLEWPKQAKESPLYELSGVINHQGTQNAGHYYAYAKVNGEWFLFNDDITKKVGEETVVNKDAYILLYKML